MGLTRETDRQNKTTHATGAAPEGKRAASTVTRSPAAESAAASTYPVHCPTCGQAHTATQHEILFASHYRPGRPGPEC